MKKRKLKNLTRYYDMMREIDKLSSNTRELKKLCLHVQTKGYSLQVDREMMEQMVTYGMESAFNLDFLHDGIKELEVKNA